MEAVPRMPMIWLDLKEAGEFQFSAAVKQFILKNYGENPDNYNEQLKKLETLRQSAVNVTRDFEGCSTLRKYFGQLHYLQSRVPMGTGQEASVPISWTEIFSGKTVTHDDISYEQACILYNLGALHSMLGAMDNRVSEEGMKVSCTHFQCSAGAFSYLRDHFSHNFSVDMSHQILNLNINLMLGQAQECLLEKSMLDNRKSFLVARISAQVVDYYKEACRALENSETASMLGKIQKDWKKLVQMKIYYFAAIAHLHMGKQAEEQQKFGERLAYLQSSLDKLNEAVKLAKGQPDSVQEALRFTMDVIGGKFNSAKKDNDFIYHESVPSLETLASVKGAPLVKALPVNPTDPTVTGPDLFAKLVPMAAHEASSLYSEEKAKLLRDVMAKIESKNETLEQFMDSLGLEPESVDNLEMYSHIPPVLMEKCAALSVRPDTVKSLIQSMQVLSGVFTDVESSLKEIRDVLEADEASEQTLKEVGGPAAGDVHPSAQAQALVEIHRDLEKYMEAHEKASFTNTELHRAMNLHISNLRLLGGPLESLREALPRPQLSEEEVAGLQCMKRILGKVQEMREQRGSLEKQLRDLIQQDDITSTLVTTERADIKQVFEEQLKKYEQVKVYIDQNLAAQENILKALTEANVQYASVRKGLTQMEQQWNSTVQMLVASYEAYEDLMKKSQEGKEFYDDLETKASRLLDRAKTLCDTRAEERKPILDREIQKKPPARPTAAKPSLQPKAPDVDSACSSLEDPELAQLSAAIMALGGDLPEELRSLPPDISSLPTSTVRGPGPEAFLPPAVNLSGSSSLPWPGAPSASLPHFPTNLPPPGLLARITQFPAAGGIARTGPLPQITQLPPQMPSQSALSGYRLPHHQSPQLGPVAPTQVRPSTTTVDSVQAPIPSYSPTPRHPVPPAASTGYSVPPQMGAYPQFMPQPAMPIQHPTQISVPQTQQQKHLQPQRFAQPTGQPLPHGYQADPRAAPGPHPQLQVQQAYQHEYIPPQPGVPPQYQQVYPGQLPQQLRNGFQPRAQICQGYQTPQGYVPQQIMPGSLSRPPQTQMPPQSAQPHMPSVSQTTPPSSQPYLHSTLTGPSHPLILSQQQQIALHSNVHQMPPNPQMQIAGGPRAQIPIANQVVPPVSQNYIPPTNQQIHQTLRPQMPPACQPQIIACPQAHLPRASLPQMPPNTLPPQHHSHPGQIFIPNMPQQPMQIPSASQAQPTHTGGVGYPGGAQTMPHQTLAPQPIAAQQPQGPHPQPSSIYPPAPGTTVPSTPQQTNVMGLHGPHAVSSQHMIQPTPGGTSASAQPPNAVPPSPSPTPSPSPGPASLGLNPGQRPTPVPTTSGIAHPTLPSQSVVPPSTSLFQLQNSSTDDLLSSSPESQPGGTKAPTNVLQPTKADPQDGERRKKSSQGVLLIHGDPYQAPERVAHLHAELEYYRAQVESLEQPSENEGGLSVLDASWKGLQDQQEKDSRQLSIAIARCYTMKNRHQDVMPYDINRVVLQSGKDDYINASYVEDLSPYCPRLIATQAPLTGTAADFWLMVYEQKVSLVVMLVSEQELEKGKVLRYFPTERGQQLSQGPIMLSLTTQKMTPTHVERMISLQYRDQSLKRTVVHLQFTSWPELGLPDSKSNLLRFIQEVHGHYLHQRPLHTPVVVHCSSGVGRTGAFCLLYAALQELEAGNGIPDLQVLVKKMRQQRKNMLQEKLHLKFCYEAVLKHAEQVLQRHGITTATYSKNNSAAATKSYSRQESQQDIVLGGDMPISSIQATIAKLSIRPPSTSDPTMEAGSFCGPEEPSVHISPNLDLTGDIQMLLAPSLPADLQAPASVSPPLSPPSFSPMKSHSPPPNGVEAASPSASPPLDPHLIPEVAPSTSPPPSCCPPVPSSLELLAALTPEAFSMDGGGKGKHRVTKQSFLQPADGQGLHGSREDGSDDPLSSLDPLWSLNKR
ncbi:tyrosine-protein phosphatase non-receptor type 23 [Thalassophryne amazonica]|uniref:tyrosine-protein phosphatase non-receptor type 23 n=1 Tax=Thalassophryne amazonica TaxID=390379 RepID=UPI001471F095|nr:tyrosine-protein phosphatase non-receptor type 23 [Thalassophryne amazonica]